MIRTELQLSETPLLLGYMPESNMPLCGLLSGQLLWADVSTTDSLANLSRLGVTTGSP